MHDTSFFHYPPIGDHGVIGDRRTAALVAADGTIDWMCLPIYDGTPVFGSLLDIERGGYWRIGPVPPASGHQRYLPDTMVLTTSWATEAWELELTDAMVWPWDNRDDEHGGMDGRVLIRQLRCVRGDVAVMVDIQPRPDFDALSRSAFALGSRTMNLSGRTATFWTNRQDTVTPGAAMIQLGQHEDIWCVLAYDEPTAQLWTVARAETALAETIRYWHDWTGALHCNISDKDRIRRSAATMHLLSYAPTGSPVAAPTTSLPERIGGDRNWDYRYAWVRDASLSLSMLSRLGATKVSQRYLDCLVSYRTSTDSPLQIVYGVNGALDLPEHQRTDLAGYRASRPVRIGNRACGQRQLDSLGFFADAALTYLDHGGRWTDDHWEMVCRAANYTVANWQACENGIWELPDEQHYVSGKVMAWVALDRAVSIAKQLDRETEAQDWRVTMAAIHGEVMERGWSERRRAFRQHYDTDDLDASTLLIPIMGFLPVDHPRVAATVERIGEELMINTFVHRFSSTDTSQGDMALGELEGAFLPCTFWLATVYAMAGRTTEAKAILAAVEAVAGDVGLFAEEIDARSRAFLGNTPLLFSHAEYLRAVLTLGQ